MHRGTGTAAIVIPHRFDIKSLLFVVSGSVRVRVKARARVSARVTVRDRDRI